MKMVRIAHEGHNTKSFWFIGGPSALHGQKHCKRVEKGEVQEMDRMIKMLLEKYHIEGKRHTGCWNEVF
jgi:hypothetical protein